MHMSDIALVVDIERQGMFERSQLQRLGRITEFHHAYPAIESLSRTHYDLIIQNPELAPGIGGSDSVIERVMKDPLPDYHKVGVRVLELVRQSGQNTTTPVIVACLCYDLESMVGKFQPVTHINMSEEAHRFLPEVKKYLRK